MRIFIAIGGLLVLLLSAVLIAPLFVDWTAFRSDFEREASRILGQPVRVLGDAEARLLPFPSLTFTDVVVGEPNAEPSMTLARFRMDAELAPYLSGEIRIFQMRLDEPHLRVPMTGDGETATLPTFSGAPGSTVVLENVVINDGRVSLQNAETGRSREFSGIDAELSARTLSGPFSGGGEVDAAGELLSFNLSSGAIEAGGRWPLRLTLGSDRLGVDFSFDGETVLGDGAPDFSGRFDLVSRVAGEEGEAGAAAAALPAVRVTSDIEITRREARLATLRAEIGPAETPYVLTGEGLFDIADIPHFDLTLRGEQVDVDRLAGEADPGGATPSFVERAETVRATLAAIPHVDIPGRIDLTLPIVTAGDTIIRDLRFAGSPSDGGWTIGDLSAELPGRTLLEASGILTVAEGLAFSGDLLVASRQPGRFAAWLTGSADPQVAQLDRAGFSATAQLSAEAQRLEDVEVDVGGQRLVGRLERGSDAEGYGILADLGGEAVDLDAFIAFARLFTGGSEILQPIERLDLRFDAGPVTYDGISADALSVDFSYGDDLLDLRNLIAENLAGADIDARGTVVDLATAPKPDIAAEIAAEAPERFVALLEEHVTGLPPLTRIKERAAAMGPLALAGTVSTPPDGTGSEVELRLQGTAAGTEIALSTTVENGLMAFERGGSFGADLTLSSETPSVLLRQLGLPGLDLGLPAPLAITASLSGDGAGPLSVTAQATAPGSRFNIDGTLDTGAEGPESGDLALMATSEDASLWLTAAGAALGQGFDAVPVDLSGRLSFAGADWALTELKGTAADTSVEASLNAAEGASVTGSARVGELSLPWLATLVYAVSPALPAEEGLWPKEPFGEPLLVPRGFAIQLAADRLDLGGGTALEKMSARLEGGSGHLRLADLSGGFGGGQLSGDATLANTGGFGSLRLDLALVEAPLSEEAVPLAGRLSGRVAIEGNGRSFAELAGSLTGEGEVQLADASALGIAPGRLPAIIEASDAEGFEIASEAVLQLVATQDEQARYPLGDLRAPVSVAVGVARILPVTAQGDGDKLTGSGTIDLVTGETDGQLTLTFLPDEDDRIADATPAVTYQLDDQGELSWRLAGVEPLTSFLSLRAYAREQDRLEALREELRESVRLRREARLYRSREAEREAERIAAEEAERARRQAEEEERQRLEAERLEGERAAEAARAAEAEAAAEREAEAARAAEEAERAAEAAREAVEAAPLRPSVPPPVSQAPPPLDFDLTPRAEPAEPTRGYEGLPGVTPLPEVPEL